MIRIEAVDRWATPRYPQYVAQWGVVIRGAGERYPLGTGHSNIDRAHAIAMAVREVRSKRHARMEYWRAMGPEELQAYACGAAQSSDDSWNATCVRESRREIARRNEVNTRGTSRV